MTTLRLEANVRHTVMLHWWQYTRREHRLCLRIMAEKPVHLLNLAYLDILIKHIDTTRMLALKADYPKSVKEVRSYLLSSEHEFLCCLKALKQNNLPEAQLRYHRAHDDLSLLRYILMENGIQSHL